MSASSDVEPPRMPALPPAQLSASSAFAAVLSICKGYMKVSGRMAFRTGLFSQSLYRIRRYDQRTR